MGLWQKLTGRRGEQAPLPARTKISGPILPKLVDSVRYWADGPWPLDRRTFRYRAEAVGWRIDEQGTPLASTLAERLVGAHYFNDSVTEIAFVVADCGDAPVSALRPRVVEQLAAEFGEPRLWDYPTETVFAWDRPGGSRVVLEEHGSLVCVILAPSVAELQQRFGAGRPGRSWEQFAAGLAEAIADIVEDQLIVLASKTTPGVSVEIHGGVGGRVSLPAERVGASFAARGWASSAAGDAVQRPVDDARQVASEIVAALRDDLGVADPDDLYARATWPGVTRLVIPALGLQIIP